MIRQTTIIFFLTIHMLSAQDIHFSQFEKTKATINPSLIANQNEDYQIQVQRRSQWFSVTKPFNTFSLSFNAKNIFNSISIGAMMLNDVAGDSYFSTDGFAISLINSYKHTNNVYAFSFQTGLFQRSFNYEELIFIQNEVINNTKINFFDIDLGFSNYKKITEKSSIIFGFSLQHLNKPNQSLTLEEKAVLNTKYIFHSTYFNSINSKMDFYPTFYFSQQGQQREFVFGSEMKYVLNNDFHLLSGAFVRMNDAIFIVLGIEKENLQVTTSYDINISSLSAASNYAGAFEIAINYGWNTRKKNKQQIMTCPKYL